MAEGNGGNAGRADKKRGRPTMTDVARIAGVSQSSVSLVLNQMTGARISGDTQQRVIEAARQIGYALPAIRREAWQRRLRHPGVGARPNAAHRALAELDASGRLSLLVTQNIDGLHLAAGSSPDRTIEIHGSIRDSVCLTCGDRRPMSETLDRVTAGEADPPCLGCGGILKSATVSFGQNLDADDLARAEAAALYRVANDRVGVGVSASFAYPLALSSRGTDIDNRPVSLPTNALEAWGGVLAAYRPPFESR